MTVDKLDNGELYSNEEDGKSKIVPKVAKIRNEWVHAV